MIRFEKITKKFADGTVAVDNVNLTVESGEFAVLIGPSGSGKTTTMKMINRLIPISSGKIYIDGEDTDKINPIELRRNIGYVIQQIGLFPHMTVGENIALVPRLKKWPEEKYAGRVDELLDLVGLNPKEYKNRFPNQLSGGQQQRIGVIRALAAEPPIILMDEPFGALDPITREQLQNELLRLQDAVKKTIVFVTHDMDEALKLGDRICIMKAGRVVQFDSSEKILREPANDFVEEFIGRERMLRTPDTVSLEEIMISDPVTVNPKRGVTEALRIMRKRRVDSLMVVDNKDLLIGILTAKDVHENINHGGQIAEIMSKDVVAASENQSVSDILSLMREKNVGYMPVTTVDGKLKGLITRTSITNVLTEIF
ncbi:ABC transporter ATP-binding protein [Dethiobacter alkaliphilus]|uniref:Quaternary amine transport ATP-binding protein n=1 Tax=Dethiobacter alkaliphilus AHT 1 TaxID=555088 RepID=C0GKE3_DETAL|nr:ABC transporter ATP-binding protein [Dethiobacter alkaliphilus]EEG76186.1 glycine betaine/L-proline ABC transporter, ATPase subunit [Dethiobacter alkaliphilus AHT 1]